MQAAACYIRKKRRCGFRADFCSVRKEKKPRDAAEPTIHSAGAETHSTRMNAFRKCQHDSMVESIWNHAEQHTEVEMNKIANSSKSPSRLERSNYKAVWTNLSETVAGAKMHVIGTEREEDLVVR